MNLKNKGSNYLYVFPLFILYLSTVCQCFHLPGNDLKNFPFQVYITGGKVDCVGVVLNEHQILTSARCLKGFLPSSYGSNWTVVAGDSNRTLKKEGTEQSREILKIIVHENYNNKDRYNLYDIAVATIAEPLVYNENVQPVTLPDKTFENFWGQATAFGWGVDNRSNGTHLDVLGSTVVSIVSNYECQTFYRRINCIVDAISDKLICAQGAQNSFNALHAEGLLTVSKGNNYTLIGILSAELGRNYTMVYTRMTEYVDWIDSIPSRLCPRGEQFMDACNYCFCSPKTGDGGCVLSKCHLGEIKQPLPSVSEVHESVFWKAFKIIGKVTRFTRESMEFFSLNFSWL